MSHFVKDDQAFPALALVIGYVHEFSLEEQPKASTDKSTLVHHPSI